MSGAPIRFIYFDLGNVLLDFDRMTACRQIGELTGLAPRRVDEVIYDAALQQRYESGAIDSRQFYDEFCRTTGTAPDFEALKRAGSDIFTLNSFTGALVAQLFLAGLPLGILSNTCEAHWEHVSDGRFMLINRAFRVLALSYRMKAAKPTRQAYLKAAELADTPPEKIFFIDDRQENVAGAREAGMQSELFTTAGNLAIELRRRGVRANY